MAEYAAILFSMILVNNYVLVKACRKSLTRPRAWAAR